MRRVGPRTESLRDPLTGRQILRARLDCGARVSLLPMAGFRTAEVAIAVPYGALDQRIAGRRVPAGLAHFLEHLMFQTPEGDAFERFHAEGAQANAWTSHDHTAYVLSCAGDLARHLDTLIDMLGSFTLPPGRIDLERDIILQEMAVYDDDPGWRSQGELLRALYPRHGLRDDIVGTRESVTATDADVLRRAFEAWYAPSAWHIVVAGNIDAPAVLRWLQEKTASLRGRKAAPRRGPGQERPPAVPGNRRRRIHMGLSRPHHLIGLPLAPVRERGRRFSRRLAMQAAMDFLFGDGGEIQDPLYEAGLADESLTIQYESDFDHAYGVVAAVVDDPRPYEAALESAWQRVIARRPRVPRSDLLRVQRGFMGRHLRRFGAVESACGWALACSLADVIPARAAERLESLTASAVSRAVLALGTAPRVRVTLV